MPPSFSWQVETVLFFLAEKEKNGFKKRFFGRGGRSEERADRGVRPYKKGVVGTLQVSPKGDAQSAETFRVVGTGATDR